MPKGITVIEHILTQERERPGATGAFSLLMSELIVAAKIVDREVKKAGLIDAFGYTGEVNVQGEKVMKLDRYANNLIISRMEKCGQLAIMASEEDPDPITISERYPKGKYVLTFDPLDGSSNIDANVSIGTIFSIYRQKTPGEGRSVGGYSPAWKRYCSRWLLCLQLRNHAGVHNGKRRERLYP